MKQFGRTSSAVVGLLVTTQDLSDV